MRRSFLVGVLGSLLACGVRPAASPSQTADRTDAILDAYLAASPAEARQVGLHAYDGLVPDYSRAGIEKRIATAKRDLADLDAMDLRAASPDARLDVEVLRWSLREEIFDDETRSLWTTSPTFYGELFQVSDYIDKEGTPVAVRRERLLKHEENALREVPHIYENLHLPLAKPIATVSADVFAGYADYLTNTVPPLVLVGADDAARARFAKLNGALAAEATKLADWLRREAIPHGDDSHVLGVDRFQKLVDLYAGTSLPIAELQAMGEAATQRDRAAFDALAATVHPTKVPEAETLQAATKLIDDARAFVVNKSILTIASNDPVIVRESPPYKRYNQAWIESYGPFETETKTSYYDITLPDPAWPADRREGYLMSRGVLRTTTVHEVMPGHFMQLRWWAKAPTRAQKSLGSSTFLEGWAHYVEQMMNEEGFGKDDPESLQGELSDALLRDCRVLVAIGIHTRGMSIADAEKVFTDRCKQDPATAHQQAIRATIDPWYFAYTLGKLQILGLREEARAALGAKFSLRAFHDAVLAHGMPPIGLIHDRVLRDLGATASTPARPR